MRQSIIILCHIIIVRQDSG